MQSKIGTPSSGLDCSTAQSELPTTWLLNCGYRHAGARSRRTPLYREIYYNFTTKGLVQ